MNRKGLSQVLALIVAAAVLMMTALSVIFMVQGGLGGLSEDTTESSCTGSVSTICTTTNSNIDLPSACTDTQGNPIPSIETDPALTDDQQGIDCEAWSQ